MTARRLAGPLIVAVLALAACNKVPETGTVVEKKYERPYTWYSSQCASYDKNGACIVSIPIAHREPEHYKVKVRNGDDSGWATVPSSEYEQYRVGDCYPIGCETGEDW